MNGIDNADTVDLMIDEIKKKNEALQTALTEKEQELGRYKSEISKLNVQLRDLINQINQELKMAQRIQKSLVPTEIPNIPGFDFSTKFIASMVAGGDYFDLFEHDDKFRFGIVMSCASGYGMSALFLSVLMKLSGQIEARKGTTPSEALSAMIKELLQSIQGQDTADVFYGVVDRRTFDMSYCLAGDLVVLHQTSAQSSIVKIKPTASEISKTFHEDLQTHSINLNAKDRLVVCSKGIFQAKNQSGEAFGTKRIEDILFEKRSSSVHEVRNEVLYRVERWTGLSEPDRDQTLLVIEVKDRILKLARS